MKPLIIAIAGGSASGKSTVVQEIVEKLKSVDITVICHDDYYKDHMELSSLILKKMSEIGGPRCCKRHAYLALETAIDYVKDKYDIVLGKSKTICEFKANNPTCLKDKCPYFR